MPAPIGAIVKLYVDLREDVREGDMIATEGGSLYQVLTSRRQLGGKKHAGRQHLTAVVLGRDHTSKSLDVLDKMEIKVHRILWYKRLPKRKK